MRTVIIGLMLGAAVVHGAESITYVQFPWRVVNGETNNINLADGWLEMRGKVIQNLGDGLYLAKILLPDVPRYSETVLLRNLPFNHADDDWLHFGSNFKAKYVGLESYTSVLGGKNTVRLYDYGAKCEIPASVKEAYENAATLAQQRKDEKARQIEEAKMKYQFEQAAKGSAFAQYEVGIRYLDGKGVEQDEDKAMLWFTRSAAQGDTRAKAMLEMLAEVKDRQAKE